MYMVDEAEELDFVRRGRAWQRTKFELGWAGINWPERYGGRGRTDIEDGIFREEEARVVSPWLTHNLGFGIAGPAIMAYGTDDQKNCLLPAMLRGDDVWCQLFSEPSAGSDLGGVRTSAVYDGGEWVVNGQKIWSSKAHFSDRGLLVTRSDANATKYKGITCFALDMRTVGVEVRPIRQMNGAAHFSEVFFSDVRIPASDVIGEVHAGWPTALSTLAGERSLIGVVGGGISTDDVIDVARRTERLGKPHVRDAVVAVYIRSEILKYLGYRVRTAAHQQRAPGPESSVMKLALSDHVTKTTSLILQLLGPAGTLSGADAFDAGRWQMQFLGGAAYRIGGGTDEIQRNTIAERVLNLPTEPRVDKGVPFREIPF